MKAWSYSEFLYIDTPKVQNDHREWPLSLAYLKEMYVHIYNFFCPFFILERRRSANTNWHIRCEVFMELSKAADLSWVRGAQLSSLYYYYYHLLFSKFGNVIFDTWKFWFSFAYSMGKIKCNLLLFKVGDWTFKCVIV